MSKIGSIYFSGLSNSRRDNQVIFQRTDKKPYKNFRKIAEQVRLHMLGYEHVLFEIQSHRIEIRI